METTQGGCSVRRQEGERRGPLLCVSLSRVVGGFLSTVLALAFSVKTDFSGFHRCP